MKKLFEDREKRNEWIQGLLLGIVCIALAISAYWNIVETRIINLIFVFFAILNLGEAFTEHINGQKVAPLCNAAIVSIVATILNIEFFDTSSKRILLGTIFNWCTAWIFIMAESFSYLSIVLYRNKRWTQEEYENWKALKEERRLKNRKESESYKIAKKMAWAENQKKKLENNGEIENLRRTAKYNRIQRKLKSEEEKGEAKQQRTQINVIAVIIMIVFVALYLSVPIMNRYFGNFIVEWVKAIGLLNQNMIAVSEGMESAKAVESTKVTELIAKYTIFYVAIVGVLISACLLLIEISKRILGKLSVTGNQAGKDSSDFMSEYATAMSILIVGFSILIAFSELPDFGMSEHMWGKLLGFLLMVLVLFVAVDIIKLILEQCIKADSLLRKCIRYIYILVINTAMEIILGVFNGLRMSEWISSIMSLLIPVPESELHEIIQKNIGEALKKETDAVKKGTSKSRRIRKSERRFQPFGDQTKNIR